VVVDDPVDAIVPGLKLYPVFQGSKISTKVEVPCWLYTR
jgi:hypothetical protein